MIKVGQIYRHKHRNQDDLVMRIVEEALDQPEESWKVKWLEASIHARGWKVELGTILSSQTILESYELYEDGIDFIDFFKKNK